jgi:hypothetical protein
MDSSPAEAPWRKEQIVISPSLGVAQVLTEASRCSFTLVRR